MNHRTRGSLAAAIVWALAAAGGPSAPAADWPAWRGPTGDGVSPEEDIPLRWSEKEGVRWRVPLPEPGSSTPIVWGDRVLLTQAVERGRRRTLICLDRRTGEVLWRAGVDWTDEETTHPSNPFCSSSPVTDGERVVAFFGSAGLHAYDLQGKELWSRGLGRIEHMGGWASSPVLHGDLCILNFGPGPGAALVAVDKRTGAPRWRVEAAGAPAAASTDAAGGPGPRGRSGGGRMLGWALFAASDADRDERISREELRALGSRWLKAADPDGSGAADGLGLVRGLLRLAGPRQEAPRADGAVRADPPSSSSALSAACGASGRKGDSTACADGLTLI